MGLLDKLKNVFFEEVEEDEEEKEEKPKEYAKKVEVPKKKINFFKKDEDFDFEEDEKKEEKKEKTNPVFDEPLELKVEQEEKEEPPLEKENSKIPMMFDVDDFLEEDTGSVAVETKEEPPISYKRENREYNENKELYAGKRDLSYVDNSNDTNYSYTKTTYYEKKETKGFKPSPIISPIYGILDKNYRKEEVVTKRETRVSGTYSKPDVDSVRKKAFSSAHDKSFEKKETKRESVDKKVYDVNNSKPQVNKVTLADADEYYNDLGLAYNVDYSDASRNTNTRSSKYNVKEKKKKDVDDNLFDLIDSMYKED